MNKFRAEDELLICVARKSLDEGTVDRLQQLTQQNIDWDHLLQTASLHGLLPLLATHLLNAAPDQIPEPILQRLKSERVESSKHSVYLVRELIRVLGLLNTNNIPALIFKGPILGQMIYGEVGLRQTGDLDLLIGKRDFSRVKDLLQANGYSMEPQLSPAQQKAHLGSHCEIQFCNQDQFSVVDLHWGLTPKAFPFFVSFEDLWTRRQTIRLAGHPIPTFSTEDLLLYLCVHGTKHYWNRLEWVASVAQLSCPQADIDWSKVSGLADTTNNRKTLRLGLLLATNIFSFELPEPAQGLLKDAGQLQKTAQALEENLFMNPGVAPTQIAAFRWNLQFMDRRRYAVRSFLRSIFVPTISDWQKVDLPDALYPFYYATRPLLLLKKYGTRKPDQTN